MSEPYGAGPGYGYAPPQAPRPGCVPLRPLGVSDILDGAFTVIRRNPKLTLGLSAAVAAVQLLLVAGFLLLSYDALGSVDVTGARNPNADTGLGPLLGGEGAQLVELVISTLLGAVLTGMLTIAITQDVLGVRLDLAEVWRRVRPRIGALLVIALVTTFLEFLGLLCFLAPGIWLWGIWAAAVPALMVEGTSVRGALGRSRHLVRGTFWRVWGIRALGALIVQVVSAFITVPFAIVGAVVDAGALSSGNGDSGLPVALLLFTALGTALAATITAPVRAGIDALLYVDLRMRKEGLDIALQQQVLVARPPAPAPRSAY